MRSHRLVAAALVGASALAGCGSAEPAAAPAADAASSSSTRDVSVSATFADSPSGAAVTYDEALVPVGAGATVTATSGDGTTTVTLEVTGLEPNREYGAHAHTMACGADGKAAGPHYQFDQDPVSPSVDPTYANADNEIWLDFTTDDEGAGSASTETTWEFPADRRAESVIIHAMPTATEPGKAGTAGDRAACITVDF